MGVDASSQAAMKVPGPKEHTLKLREVSEINMMTEERMYTVPEVAQFFGITQQAVRQRIIEGRLEASKVRVKGVAREYRISAEAIQEHYDLSDAEMRQLAKEGVRYRVGFMGWGLGLPFPDYRSEHFTYEKAVDEAKRVLAILPQFREENAEMEQWLPVKFPRKPDKAIIYPDPFDFVKHGMKLEHPTVEIIDAVESTT